MMARRLAAIFRSLITDERGNVLAMTAVGLPLLLGCAGLAVDTIQWVSAKRELQSAADAAAIAGVYGLVQTGDMEQAVDASLASNRNLHPHRAVLAERFRHYVGEPPIGYLTRWRLQLAAQALTTTPRGVADIAAEVGYESEAAFNRAFKRLFGAPPARYRREHRSTDTHAAKAKVSA